MAATLERPKQAKRSHSARGDARRAMMERRRHARYQRTPGLTRRDYNAKKKMYVRAVNSARRAAKKAPDHLPYPGE